MRKTKYSFLISAAVMASLVLSCQAAQADDNTAPATNVQSTAAATTTPAENSRRRSSAPKWKANPTLTLPGLRFLTRSK